MESYRELRTVEYFFKTIVNVQYMPVFVYYFLYVWQHGVVLPKMVLSLYVLFYNVLKVMIIQVVNSLNIFSNSRFSVALFKKSFY